MYKGFGRISDDLTVPVAGTDAIDKEKGYQFLQEIAGKFTDEDLRRSFLENVAAHREITAEYAGLDQP